MGSSNDRLYDIAKFAIDRLFNDRSVDKEAAKVNLQTLRDEIDVHLESLEHD